MEIPYKSISGILIGMLIRSDSIDDVEVDGVTYCFDRPKVTIEYDRIYTGVGHLGDRESYLKRSIRVGRLHCSGVFDSAGEEIACIFDTDKLTLTYSDDSVSISYN